MEKLNPLTCCFLMLFFSMFGLTATAQTKENKVAIKEWLIANENKVTLISTKEYQQMSPAVKAVLDADKQTLVYNQHVTQKDLEAFEQKNDQGNYTSIEAIYERSAAKKATPAKLLKEQVEENQYKLSKWLDAHQKSNIKIISRQNYESRSVEERTYIDALENKIIYDGVALTLEDVKAFDQKKH
ncbi:MAG: Unknown protein [uncultured Aureispira sp.]|uniref:Uncharacterized protein n=1 Tax=uncultured Aureispira sp. TaxID=1331704 RepID=A0A6S6SED0_9BACT|nr:MAG: Unknown protein [uncultured Aureispira sp.]